LLVLNYSHCLALHAAQHRRAIASMRSPSDGGPSLKACWVAAVLPAQRLIASSIRAAAFRASSQLRRCLHRKEEQCQ
jgi:hypothetical protein